MLSLLLNSEKLGIVTEYLCLLTACTLLTSKGSYFKENLLKYFSTASGLMKD